MSLTAALWALRLIRWRSLLSRWVDGRLNDARLRSWSMLDLRWQSEFLLRWWGLMNRRLDGSGVDDPRLRSRSVMDLRRWRFDFLLRRC
jgi:hypothetical protein